MAKISIVLFDVDGTLIIHNELMPNAIRDVMDRVDCQNHFDERNITGNTDFQNLKLLTQRCGHPLYQDEDFIADLCKALARQVVTSLPLYDLKPCVGVFEALNRISAKALPMGLLTGNLQAMVRPKLAAAGINPNLFSFGGYGDHKNTRTDVANAALNRAQMFFNRKIDPSTVLIIGDTPKDIACARAVSAKILAVSTGLFNQAELALHHPDFLLEDLSDPDELLRIIDG
jgi:phosphoglycolate phosphatase-like HAD superfamily hydrolase